MSTDKPPPVAAAVPSSSLSDLATRINIEFAAIQKADRDANKTVVQRAITFGRTLSQAKGEVGHGRWEKWLNDNCRDISVRTRFYDDLCRATRQQLEALKAFSQIEWRE